ncbi:phospholipase D-like domain-containing protein [Nocardia sp. NPDC052566]|uniref:phospholipase D-like domain-containing protein n=1 Tax=Nocardia sp. NPDC052566 TaxID=3364330 RepID=UPI0037C85C91
MTIRLKVYANEDDALLYWRPSEPIEDCRGFAIERRRTQGAEQTEVSFLRNRIGFATEPVIDVVDTETEEARPVSKPSTEWPFQRFSWTDHDAKSGDTVSYRVIPVVRDPDRTLRPVRAEASRWSSERTLGATPTGTYRPFFNRAFVISQFMARYLAENHLSLRQFKARISDRVDDRIRAFLAGGLRTALLELLDGTADDHSEVYAALFELGDTELITHLAALGPRAHVVLANGSIQKEDGETTAQARTRDENKDARAELVAAGVDVEQTNRFTSPGPLGHNKFLVRTDHSGDPVQVWTGSTNWTPTGLCTQINNGLLIDDPATAAIYLEQWHRLRDAGSAFPPALTTSNSAPHPVPHSGSVASTVWFTRSAQQADLDALRQEVAAARQGILFLMFMPGATGLFSDVQARANEPDLYVRGVVSELPRGRADESRANIDLVDGRTRRKLRLDIVRPEGVRHPFARFAAEVTHEQFLSQVGHAIVHSKVLVIDPFSDNATVITGSHNFSLSASSKNDENFVIIKGDRALAEAYAVNIYGVYAHYRWRSYLGQTRHPFNGLRDNDTWMAPMLRSNARDLKFWGA